MPENERRDSRNEIQILEGNPRKWKKDQLIQVLETGRKDQEMKKKQIQNDGRRAKRMKEENKEEARGLKPGQNNRWRDKRIEEESNQ